MGPMLRRVLCDQLRIVLKGLVDEATRERMDGEPVEPEIQSAICTLTATLGELQAPLPEVMSCVCERLLTDAH